jgi:hypothetical protein
MLLGRALILVIAIVFVAWLIGGLLRGRTKRHRR